MARGWLGGIEYLEGIEGIEYQEGKDGIAGIWSLVKLSFLLMCLGKKIKRNCDWLNADPSCLNSILHPNYAAIRIYYDWILTQKTVQVQQSSYEITVRPASS